MPSLTYKEYYFVNMVTKPYRKWVIESVVFNMTSCLHKYDATARFELDRGRCSCLNPLSTRVGKYRQCIKFIFNGRKRKLDGSVSKCFVGVYLHCQKSKAPAL